MDKIGDLLNRIATANPHTKEVIVSNSKYKQAILKVLYEEGWIAGVTSHCTNPVAAQLSRNLVILLKKPYIDASNLKWTSVNLKVSRISKPGRRLYAKAHELKKLIYKVTNLSCTIVVSTNKGVMTLKKAVDLNIGGELLFKLSA